MPDTGSPYFIPYAEPTDLVRDWPELSEDVALAIVAALENIPVTEKRIEAFTGSGTWTVPAGVTYAIAHMLGGGGGGGSAGGAGSAGAASSVAFASGTVSSTGGTGGPLNSGGAYSADRFTSGAANTGRGVRINGNTGVTPGQDSEYVVAGAAVTPAASITVTVGGGGATGGSSGAKLGGSGYVYIEYYEEV